MGKMTDAAVALLVLAVGVVILTRLGITWSILWSDIHTFVYGTPSTNTTAGMIFGVSAAARKQKIVKRVTEIRRNALLKFIRKTEKEARERV